MQTVRVDFTNCYGIRKLTHEFDTSEGLAFLVYAPNGAMKSSFARVFADVAKGLAPKDSIFKSRTTSFAITDENGSAIPPDRILVVEPYSKDYSSEKTATLMADQGLRQQYELLVKTMEDKATLVFGALGKATGLRSSVQAELTATFGGLAGDGYTLLETLYAKVMAGVNPGMDAIRYVEVFNDKVLPFLEKSNVRTQIAEYVQRYDELVSKSTYFRAGVFNHNHAMNVRKALEDNRFFDATHTVWLAARDESRTEITSAKALGTAIDEEKQRIFADSELTKKFEAIDREITRNAELRQFRDYLDSHRELIPELTDLAALRKKLWLSYAFAARDVLADFAETYRTAKAAIGQVMEKARTQQTQWQNVLEIFHRRFSVPFVLEVGNQPDVILKSQAPSLVFKYKEGAETVEIGRNELLSALSTGEQRALYLLNVIFELEARKQEAAQTVLILDDVADSFDYKNKYAIVEYLKAMHKTGKFIMIILTHNFDFFRTVQSRLSIGRNKNCLMVAKSSVGVNLLQAQNLKPFQAWKRGLARDRKLMLAAIPLARNLVEYRNGESDPDFLFLTSLLHRKPGSDRITMTDLANVLNRVLGTAAAGNSDKVIDVILQEAQGCLAAGFTINLENKVILSMAIRLLAEELMIAKINDATKTGNIAANQTGELFEIYQSTFPGDTATIGVLDRVMLMTPESIHLNSFMYEPILDMSDDHLHALWDDVTALLAPIKAPPALV